MSHSSPANAEAIALANKLANLPMYYHDSRRRGRPHVEISDDMRVDICSVLRVVAYDPVPRPPSPANADLNAVYDALVQAQDCIRGETPEDITHEEAREDTINKVRDAMRTVEGLLISAQRRPPCDHKECPRIAFTSPEHQSAPLDISSLPSGESDPAVTPGFSGADTAIRPQCAPDREALVRAIQLSYARKDLEPTSATTLALYRDDAENAADAVLALTRPLTSQVRQTQGE